MLGSLAPTSQGPEVTPPTILLSVPVAGLNVIVPDGAAFATAGISNPAPKTTRTLHPAASQRENVFIRTCVITLFLERAQETSPQPIREGRGENM